MGPLIGLVLLFIVISVLNDSFIDPSNLKNLARQISINALIAFGMTFVILTGGFDPFGWGIFFLFRGNRPEYRDRCLVR